MSKQRIVIRRGSSYLQFLSITMLNHYDTVKKKKNNKKKLNNLNHYNNDLNKYTIIIILTTLKYKS